MKRSKRSRLIWWLEFAQVAVTAILGAVGVLLVGGPEWAAFGLAWTSALIVETRQRLERLKDKQ